jgi:hypothetical protein
MPRFQMKARGQVLYLFSLLANFRRKPKTGHPTCRSKINWHEAVLSSDLMQSTQPYDKL